MGAGKERASVRRLHSPTVVAVKEGRLAQEVERKNAETRLGRMSALPPRVLVVSRGFVRKNKVVDFVGEYHLELLVRFGACPIIVPRVEGIAAMLDAFEPIHGVLLIEGQDVSPDRYCDSSSVPDDGQWRALHASDAELDHSKDDIEFELARRCIERRIPFLGICRGSQVFNVAAGGTLYTDVESELGVVPGNTHTRHVDYLNYDVHRHPVSVVPGTPLHAWFDGVAELQVNSYHHQGVKRLASRFAPMALAPDGLIEAYWDPLCFAPARGEFVMGFQFHPERMRDANDALEHDGCARVYEAFCTAVRAYEERILNRAMREIEASFEVARERSLQRSNTAEERRKTSRWPQFGRVEFSFGTSGVQRPRASSVHGVASALSQLESDRIDTAGLSSTDASTVVM
mmetsp:Transcript_5949/g.15809  ORF Transcript_5949/g.15809 Transcript_5949/m.15809 type:complete len:402 (+) Transcript_5949:169-1374(+)